MRHYIIDKTLGNLGKYTDEVASYDQAIAINPNYSEAWNNRGWALAKLGRYSAAESSYAKAKAVANQNLEIALKNQSQAQQTSATSIQTSTTLIQTSDIPLPQQTQQQTKNTPLLYAPIGAIVFIVGITVWSRRGYSPPK